MVGEQYLLNKRKLMDKNKPGTTILPSKSTKRGNTDDNGTGRKSKKRKFVLVGKEWGNKDGNKEIDCTIEERTTPLNIEAGEAMGERDGINSGSTQGKISTLEQEEHGGGGTSTTENIDGNINTTNVVGNPVTNVMVGNDATSPLNSTIHYLSKKI